MYTDDDAKRLLATRKRIPEANNQPYRTPWRRDYDRILHTAAFRRLQGKTQLFPGTESDFFRNRLTHSLEVAQLASAIAVRLNATVRELVEDEHLQIDPDLTKAAALAHDLGHPPFGHIGEDALNECMRDCGGFEGNAQTLRILVRLIKRQRIEAIRNNNADEYSDQRVGLNWTYRSLASVLKYDSLIPLEPVPSENSLIKGYYATEREIVTKIRTMVTGRSNYTVGDFRTIECQIMDIADDIAYSVFDLEDAFEGQFLTPFDLITADPDVYEKVAKRVSDNYPRSVDRIEVQQNLMCILADAFKFENLEINKEGSVSELASHLERICMSHKQMMAIARDGYLRGEFISDLISEFFLSIKMDLNVDIPAMSRIYMDEASLLKMEVLKHFIFVFLISSPTIRMVGVKGRGIILELFDIISRNSSFMPDSFQQVLTQNGSCGKEVKKRIICDFISGMTDRYALEFYGRLNSETPQTIFKSPSIGTEN